MRKVGRERLSSFAIATYNSPLNWGRIIFSRENYTNNLSASAITPFASRQRVHEVLLITRKTMSSKRMICLILNCMYFPFSPTKLLYFLRPSKSFRLFCFFPLFYWINQGFFTTKGGFPPLIILFTLELTIIDVKIDNNCLIHNLSIFYIFVANRSLNYKHSLMISHARVAWSGVRCLSL